MKVLVLGSTGFLGSWVVKKLKELKPEASISEAALSKGTDLRDGGQTSTLFKNSKPEFVINCAADVGGIQYGYLHSAEIYHNNLEMVLNIFRASSEFKVKRLIQPISNCAYPARERFFKEKNFWNGPLDESVLVYGMVRKMAWVGSWAYQKQYGLDTANLVLSNMYGPGDHFDEIRSHALGALVKKILDAKIQGKKEVVVWGTGKPVREWLYVEDGAEAMVRALDMESCPGIVNVGTGEAISVIKLANLIKKIAGWGGKFVLDTKKADGAPYKMVDGSKGRRLLGWQPQVSLERGIKKTVDYYLAERVLRKG